VACHGEASLTRRNSVVKVLFYPGFLSRLISDCLNSSLETLCDLRVSAVHFSKEPTLWNPNQS
jgi:hypothetical protein